MSFLAPSQIASATGPTSISSTSFTSLVSITPKAGTYLVWGAASYDWASGTPGSGSREFMRISAGGTAATNSLKTLSSPGFLGRETMNVMARVTVNGSQSIDLEMASSDGAVSVDVINMQLTIQMT